MTPLTLQRLAEIEAAAAEYGAALIDCRRDTRKWMDLGIHTRYHAALDPQTVAALCRKCRHFAAVFRPRCQHGDFPVTKNATCGLWVPG